MTAELGTGHGSAAATGGGRTGPFAYVAVAVLMALATAAVYAPFAPSLTVVHRYWDGPHYMYIARVGYAIPNDQPFQQYGVTPAYYALHLPLYPLVIRLLAWTTGDYPTAMLLATIYSAMAAAGLFYRVLVEYRLVASPLWTAFLFCFLPPRWLIYHAVGATEPLFFCCLFLALLAYRRERVGWLVAGIGLACLTRVTGLLLIGVFATVYLSRRRFAAAAAMPLAGLGVLGLAIYHRHLYGSYLTYFHQQAGARAGLSLVPFARIREYLEDPAAAAVYVGLFALYGLGTILLRRHRVLCLYSLAVLALNALVRLPDLDRFFIPAAPFALLVGFDRVLTTRAARVLAPLVIYLSYHYAWDCLPQNGVDHLTYLRLLQSFHAE